MSEKSRDTHGPLSGVRVVELAGLGPAPFAGSLLADLGADVVRIDRPGGDEAVPTRFDFYNRNKRSIVLDLKTEAGKETALKAIAKADLLIEGFRPGVTERLGLDPASCFAVNPRLVYGRMTGWGQTGPLAKVAGHDINYLGLTGALHAIGGAAAPSPPLNLVADLGGGALYLVVGVLAALHEAKGSGKGQVVDAAMIDGVANLMSIFQSLRQLGTWSARREDNLLDGGAHFYRTYATSDGKYVAVGALEPAFYAQLVDGLGLGTEALPAQYDRAHWPAMRERFAAVFATKTRDAWVAELSGRDACVSPVLEIEEVADHPQMKARNVFTAFDEVIHPSPAPRFDRTPGSLRRPTPTPGQHTAEVLAEWGIA